MNSNSPCCILRSMLCMGTYRNNANTASDTVTKAAMVTDILVFRDIFLIQTLAGTIVAQLTRPLGISCYFVQNDPEGLTRAGKPKVVLHVLPRWQHPADNLRK